jgi:cysteine desulfurase family protein (TIGR01976 family)
VPQAVIDAIDGYLRDSNANTGGAFPTSRRTDALVEEAHAVAARFLGATPAEVAFGPNMTTLNFALTRTLGRELAAGDEIVVTRLDHDANVAPWLELARDLGLEVRFADVREDCTLDLDGLAALVGERTRVVAFPWASNAVGTVSEVRRIAALAHEAGALAWVDAVHYAPHGPIDVAAVDADVLLCSAYKFFGPHLGLAFVRRELLERWRPYKVRPAPDDPPGARLETGTAQHELLAGFVAAVEYVDSLGWEAITAYERALGERFLAGLPDAVTLHGLPTMAGRVPTFCFSVPGRTARSVAEHLATRDVAVWWGNYYALETMRRLGLDEVDGAVRAGIVHYNTVEEVDRLLAGVGELV